MNSEEREERDRGLISDSIPRGGTEENHGKLQDN
jgi:hypothetical protein